MDFYQNGHCSGAIFRRIWELVFNPRATTRFLPQIIRDGTLILGYQDLESQKYVRAYAFETEFEGMRCIAVNRGFSGSRLFSSLWDPEKYDAMLAFVWKEGHWSVYLYTEKDTDLSVPQVLPSAVSPVVQQQLIERTTARILKVIVKTADPGFVRIRQHYVDVNRRILREDNKFVDQFLCTGESEFD